MIYISDRSAANLMRYSIRGFFGPRPANGITVMTDVARLVFLQVPETVITDPAKMAAVKSRVRTGLNAVTIGMLSATLAYDEALNIVKVQSIDAANQAAKNTATGTPNLCLVEFSGINGADSGSLTMHHVTAALPVGPNRPVELAGGGVFTSVGQALRLKSFAFRIKGY